MVIWGGWGFTKAFVKKDSKVLYLGLDAIENGRSVETNINLKPEM